MVQLSGGDLLVLLSSCSSTEILILQRLRSSSTQCLSCSCHLGQAVATSQASPAGACTHTVQKAVVVGSVSSVQDSTVHAVLQIMKCSDEIESPS
jgi:hypothetical protein